MYPNQPQPYQPHDPRAEAERQKAGLFKAGKVAMWIWIALAAVAVLAVVGCIGLCGLGGLAFIGTPTPTPTP